MTIEQYRKYEEEQALRNYWRGLADSSLAAARVPGFIPPIKINSQSFEKIFGGSNIDIRPQGSADLTLSGRINKNENPLFNERQRTQANFDFDQRIQMNVIGQIGEKLKLGFNYNTDAQFDFENQMKLDYTGKPDEIIRKIEAGNVSLPLNTTLITGSQALFGLKTQLQFGKLGVTTILSQQKSQTKTITIANGSQQNEFSISADNYETNKHYFLAGYFRNNYNRALANTPIITSNINITKVEVWITNRNNSTNGSRDILGFLDLGENQPFNTAQIQGGAGFSSFPAGFVGPGFTQQSNTLLQNLPAGSRLTNSNAINAYFQANGGTDNYVKLTYAQKLTDREFILNPRLGYISLNRALNADEVLAVAYRYTVNGTEYQVGEFSTDITVDPNNPQVLYAKLLKNETLKTNLPIWDLMMKNIYSLGAYQVNSSGFNLRIFRLDDNSGVEKPLITEGLNTNGKQWLQLTGVDRLNPQNDKIPDGYFDFLDGITIDPLNGRITFPLIEPFGADLRAQFALPTEQALAEKYIFQPLYDSTRVIAQQLFPRLNRYVIRGTYQSEITSEFSLNAINVPAGSVQVFAGALPLVEGTDFTVDYNIGRVKILNLALLNSGQRITTKLENSEAFGLQQRSLFGNRFDYRVNNRLNLGATIMNLTEKPLTAKINLGEEAISNTIWGVDANYSSPSRWLTRMVDKLPFLDTKEPSSITFAGEFANLIPGHPRALNFAGSSNGASYIDDFESSRSIIDLKSPISWQVAPTPRLFPESQLSNDLAYGYNRARLAFYTIDPVFFRGTSLTPNNIKNNRTELSDPYTREVLEQEVFPFKQSATGQPLTLPTFDMTFYPMERGPHNYTTTGLNANGTLANPASRWGGIFRKIDAPDFEALNIEYIELWVEDPFIKKPASAGGDLYFNLGSIPEDILKDGRKSLENGLATDGTANGTDQTVWGRVPKLQPVIQAFDNSPASRRFQDVGLDGFPDSEERGIYAAFLNQVRGILNPAAMAKVEADPSTDNYHYYRGDDLDNENAGILRRYERYNGSEANSKTSEQSRAETGIENTASTSLPDGEDINRDNNSSLADEYYQYRLSVRPADMVVGQNFITDKVTSTVRLANGNTQQVSWYQFRIPISQYQSKVGNIQDFKSIRFIRMFYTNFQDTITLRLARLQLLRGEWRRYNSENNTAKVLADPALGPNPAPDASTLDVGTINIEENGTRQPIPYVVPPGIDRERDFSNFRGDTRQNEQSLSVNVANLRDGYARAAFKTTTNDFRSYRRIEMFIHAEGNTLRDGDITGFIRVGTDNQDNYYEYEIPLRMTANGSRDPSAIWPEANRLNIELARFQAAKTARNGARLNGAPYPVNLPFIFLDGANKITVKGQPDLSKVRVLMLGVRNPRRTAATPADDGFDKTAQVWFNELRLTDFDERGGWATTARLNARLADFADVTVSGSKSTVGFGSIEKRVSERNRTDDQFFDVSSSIEAGKFFPARSGIQIPMYINFSSQTSLPQFDPRTPDIELKNALRQLPAAIADSVRFNAVDYTSRKSINFTNVRKLRIDPNAKNRLWNVENFSATYTYNEFYHHDFINQLTIQRTYRGSLDYVFSNPQPKTYAPFEKLIKSSKLALLRDLNFSPMPTSINVRVNVDRLYSENTLRNNDLNNFVPITTTFNKNYLMTRQYGLSWNLTRSLKADFSSTNLSVIDEPDGRITNRVRDSIWSNLRRFGRNTNYNHTMSLGYITPINKIPGLGFANLLVGYGSTFSWRTEPLSTLRDPLIDFGNTIENTREIQLNPSLNFDRIGFIRKINTRQDGGTVNSILRVLTSLRRITGSYQKKQGTFLPGYQPSTNLLGYDLDENAPGWNFLFGGQQDIRSRAIRNGWITRDTLQNQLYITTSREDLRFQGNLEPAPGLTIDLTTLRSQSFNYSTNFRFDPTANDFRNLSPITTGDYNVSFLSLKTAFADETKLFRKFEENRAVISQRLGVGNPNSGGAAGPYSDGYGSASQDVIVNAFLATYSGKDASKMNLRTFPNIPVPNWRIRYTGLTRFKLLSNLFNSFTINHEYRSTYSVGSFSSLVRYQLTNGGVSVRDVNSNFLPRYQFGQVAMTELFSPLIGADAQLKNNMTTSFEYRTSRTLVMGLANSQLAHQRTADLVFRFGYLTNDFRFPFGLFGGTRLKNNMNFQVAATLRDNKVLIYRADVVDPEVSSGAKNITFSPSIDYVLNQRFNVKLFYDGNVTRPYTSQTFNTSFSNFGVSTRFILQ